MISNSRLTLYELELRLKRMRVEGADDTTPIVIRTTYNDPQPVVMTRSGGAQSVREIRINN